MTMLSSSKSTGLAVHAACLGSLRHIRPEVQHQLASDAHKWAWASLAV